MFFKHLFTCIHVPFSFVSHCSIYPQLFLGRFAFHVFTKFFDYCLFLLQFRYLSSSLFSSFSSPFCYFFRHFLTPLFTFFYFLHFLSTFWDCRPLANQESHFLVIPCLSSSYRPFKSINI
jgi:hypothetical protein